MQHDPPPMDVMIATLPVIVLLGLLVLAAMWIWRRTKIAEMVHRERLAMIERGLMPPPEAEPVSLTSPPPRAPNVRFRTMGVTLVGLGLGLIVLIALAADKPDIGLGVGGAIAILGIALVVNGYLSGAEPTPAARRFEMHAPRHSPGPSEDKPPAL